MDPKKIKGDIQHPYNPPEKKDSSEKIDPEKFKKVMKIDESEEAQKRKKRNLSKEEEEGVNDEVQEETLRPPSTSFSEHMSDKDQLDTVFDKKSGGIRRQAAPEEGAAPPPSESISTEGVDLNQESKPPSTNTGFSSAAPSESQENNVQQPPPSQEAQPLPPRKHEQPSENTPHFQGEFEQAPPQQLSHKDQTQQTETTPSSRVEKPTKKPKKTKKKEKDTSLLASQPKTKDLEKLKKKKSKGIAPKVKVFPGEIPSKKKETPSSKIEKGLSKVADKKESPSTIIPTQEKPSQKKEKKLPESSAEETTKKISPFHRFTPEDVRNQKEDAGEGEIEGLSIPTSTESNPGGMGGQKKKKDNDSFTEANSETAGIPLPTFTPPLPPIIPTTEVPAYSKLSPEMYELFEKIGGVIMITQDQGKTTTTMNINMPESVFDGTQIILDQYSTAPNSYNIQLIGNPDSIKVFNQNLDTLKDSFKQGNFNFEANILNPILSTKKKPPHLIRRSKSAGDKGGRGGKQDK